MQPSRRDRRRNRKYAALKRMLLAGLTVLLAVCWLLSLYYGNLLMFALLGVLAFSGSLLANFGAVRSYIPYLDSASPLVRILVVLLFLSGMLALIGLAGG